jgi:hypothetical protein
MDGVIVRIAQQSRQSREFVVAAMVYNIYTALQDGSHACEETK